MASVASHVVFHPVVSQSLKVTSTALGRDKLYRAVQYFSRFLAWYYVSRGDKANAVRFNSLKVHLAIARKLIRLGKPIEHMQAALRDSAVSGPAAERLTAVGRQIAYCGFLSYDALVWANTVKLINLSPETTLRISKTSNRFWVVGILLSILNALVKAPRIKKEYKLVKANEKAAEGDARATLKALSATAKATRRQLIMDLLDVWSPATALGLVNLSDGVVGIFGTITSIMSLQSQWAALDAK